MPLVLSRENILLSHRNIKNNKGSNTAGTDSLTIADIGRLTPEDVTMKIRYIVSGTKRGYLPKPVRRKDIMKSNGGTRANNLLNLVFTGGHIYAFDFKS